MNNHSLQQPVRQRNHRQRGAKRRLRVERLEHRRVLAANLLDTPLPDSEPLTDDTPAVVSAPATDVPFHNEVNPYDVNHSGGVSALDALVILNYLGRYGSGPAGQVPLNGDSLMSYDVNGDGEVAGLDALVVVNQLGRLNAVASESGDDPQALEADTTGPTITDLKVAASAWSPTFLNAIDPVDGEGLSLPGADQLKNLTWFDLDTIIVEFNEDVQQAGGTDIDLSDLSLVGLNVLDYQASPGLTTSYSDGGGAGPFKLTITLDGAATFDADKLRLAIYTTVQDAAGNPLNGEWIDAVSTVSGDATEGGQFTFHMDVLPGDTSNDDFLLGDDIDIVNDAQFTFAG